MKFYARPHHFSKDFNENVRSKASQHQCCILSLIRNGPDRSKTALLLWRLVALPAILYGVEVMPITQTTIDHVQCSQNAIAKFALQIPVSSTNAAVVIEAGLLPIKYLVCQRVVSYLTRLRAKHSTTWAHRALICSVNSGNKFYQYFLSNLKLLASYPEVPEDLPLAIKCAVHQELQDKLDRFVAKSVNG